jgi:hypothetical protein
MNEIEKRLPTKHRRRDDRQRHFKKRTASRAASPQNAKKIYDSLDKNFGVLSLSETPTDSLLWGYYGDGGYGFLIRFDPQHEWFWAQQNEQDDFRPLRQAAYVATRVPKYVVEINGADALYSKGIDGSTRENGASFAISTMPNRADQYGKEVLLFAIPADCLPGIVIGYRAKPESVARLREIVVRNPGLSHVQPCADVPSMANGGRTGITLLPRSRADGKGHE